MRCLYASDAMESEHVIIVGAWQRRWDFCGENWKGLGCLIGGVLLALLRLWLMGGMAFRLLPCRDNDGIGTTLWHCMIPR